MMPEAETRRFEIGLTADFLKSDGSIGLGDIGLSLLDARPDVAWRFLDQNNRVLTHDEVAPFDALAVLAPRITSETVADQERLSVIARYGVGYDSVDIDACTKAGIAVTITPDGVRTPVATVVLTFLLALTHRLFEQDRATRAGEGWTRKLDLMGYGLTGKTIGLVGLGNIGREVVRLIEPLRMRPIAYDPYLTDAQAAERGVQRIELDELMRQSDYVVVTCALTPETHHLLNAERLGLMKETAFLINPARGPIVDQTALTEALRSGAIRGAALDVYEQEPIDPSDPLLSLDNVIVTPHALCWTDEWAFLSGRSAMESMLAVADGANPRFVVNRDVLETPRYKEKLARRSRASDTKSGR